MTQSFQVRVSMNQAAVVKSGLVLKQGDFGMNLEIEVLNFDTSNTTPQIVFRKPMGAVESTSVTKSGNVYTYTIQGTELDTPGKVICDLKLKNSTTQRISTASFSFEVVADTLDGLAEEASSYSDTIAQIIAEVKEEVNTNMAPQYNALSTYNLGDYVIYNDLLYRCKVAINTAEAWTSAHWQKVKIGNETADLKSDLASEYDSINGTYGIGDYCIYFGKLYRCITAITTPENFSSSKWRLTSIENELISLFGIDAKRYNNSLKYSVNDYCIYSGKLYRCITAITTPENFSSSKWTNIEIGTEFSDLHRILYNSNGFDKSVENVFSDTVQYNGENITLSFVAAEGYYTEKGKFTPYSGISKAEILSLTVGDVYLLSNKSYYGMALCLFFDINDKFISSIAGSGVTQFNDIVVTVPENAAKLLIQRYSTNAVKLSKVTEFVGIAGKFTDELQNTIDSKFNAISKKVYTDITLSFVDTTGFYNANGVFVSYDHISAADVAVEYGESYILSIQGYSGVQIAVFFDENNSWIQSIQGTDNLHVIDYYIDVPYGAVKMIIQRYYGRQASLKKETGITNIPAKSVLDNKKITVIGDSITEHNFRAKTNWAMYIADWCGAIIQNLGISGSGFVNGSKYVDRINQIQESPDIIGIAMSFNDFTPEIPVGTASDTGTSTIAGYANDFFTALQAAYPTTPIICYCQGPWAGFHPGTTNGENWITVLKRICALKGIPFYDKLFYGSVLRPWVQANREVYYVSDNDAMGNTGVVDDTHPNSEGHKVIARYLYPKFAQNVVATGMDYQ